MAEKQNTPEIRFEGFTDPWEQRKLGEVATRHDNLRIPITAKDRIPGDTPYYGANGIQDYVEGYTHEGEFVLVAEDGATDLDNYPVQLISGLSWVNNHAHVIKAIPDVAQNRFIMHLIKSMDIASYLVGGTRSKLNAEVLMGIELKLPSNSEQIYIGALLSTLDSLITLHQRKYDKLCTVKKSMLDKMFPKPGETEPDIRFEGFTDPWEQRKLGDLISVYIAHAGPEEDVTVLTSSRDGIQKQEDHFGRLQQHDTSDWNLIPYGYCTYRNRSDDGLFTFNVNKVADRGIVSKFYPVFETPECDADFLVAYLNSSQEIRKKLFVLAVGTSQVVLSYGALKELSLLLPQNREQSAIANVLNHIDNLITLHQRKLELLRNIKKSLLDRMFV